MDAVTVPSETVPAELKQCEQILKRAKELKKAEPVVAYWCCFSAAQKAIKVPNRSKEGTVWLMSLLDALEQMKKLLEGNDAVMTEAAGAAYVENFALKVFMSADNDDRAGNTGKATIRKFVVAGQFIEVLRCFENGMTEEMEQKLQYARWKAADGAKALREGRTPTSGPPLPEEEINPFPELPSSSPGEAASAQNVPTPPSRGSFSNPTRPVVQPPSISSPPTSSQHVTPSPRPSPGLNGRNAPLPPAIDTLRTPTRTQSAGSGAWSTVATPGLADDDEEPRFPLDDAATPQPSAPPLDPDSGSPTGGGGDRKNVRFMGPDGAPLSPATTHVSVDSYDAPAAPPPSTFAPSPSVAKKSSAPPPPLPPADARGRSDSASSRSGGSNPARPRGNSNSNSTSNPTTIPYTSAPANRLSPIPGSIPLPPAPPPSLASYPAGPSALGLTSGAAPSAPPPAAPTRKQVEQSQKHARWAISALEFDDYDTARSELRKALAQLG